MAPTSLEGQTLGKYRVMEPLGTGGMARVYKAYHPQLDRYVALKILRSDLVDDEDFLARFRREARAVAALRHPNIVQVFDSDVEDDVYYIVLELLPGDTLKARLNHYRIRGERMPLGEIMRIMFDVLDGLAYAHSEGMIHRDIKPGNILLTERGQAVVADFGIAQIVGSTQHTASGALMGTLDYMAPEQGLEGHSDIRSDLYSLGIVLYEMLTQRAPFEADTPLAVLMKHVNDPLPLPRKTDPTIPEPLERIVLKALAKHGDDRYQSAEEMAQALRAAAEESGIDLPARISLPLSFTTPESPSDSVAVLSGTARDGIADDGFARDDTDESPAQQYLGASSAAGSQSLGQAGKELLSAVSEAAQVAMGKATKALREAADVEGGNRAHSQTALEIRLEDVQSDVESGGQVDTAEESRTDRRRREKPRRSVATAVLGAIGIMVIGNLALISVAAPTGSWWIFELAWPAEILLVGWGLCLIMFTTSSIWLLIPASVVLTTGAILAYCNFTGYWDHWEYLWIYEVWTVALSVGVSAWIGRYRRFSRLLGRLLAVLLGLVALGGVVAILWIARMDYLMTLPSGLILP